MEENKTDRRVVAVAGSVRDDQKFRNLLMTWAAFNEADEGENYDDLIAYLDNRATAASAPSVDRNSEWRDCDTCDGTGRISSVELCQRCDESGILPGAAPQQVDAVQAVPETQHQRNRRVIGEALNKAKEGWMEMLGERSDRMDWFMAWFLRNYPADTVILDPAWHAPRIFAAAEFATKNHPLAASPSPAVPPEISFEQQVATLLCGETSLSAHRCNALAYSIAKLAQPTDTTAGE